ncbi:CitMHS family transporter [Acetonema longum]|uniref:Secondary transporter of divalent metal ions/citrate complexes n=1 Tax=Acetonema longum DSM 6540 TaxID=1009370 RepID=F7NP79_9FIRM|nr:citrate:proton symporter [Acetonema longum]EGO62202.1 secondary transporter of divalent metal ions/citrate complexes [Acetonema longum DSM 6540]
MSMSLALLGYLTIAIFMALLMGKKLSAFVSLIIVPVAMGLLGGMGGELGDYALKGLKGVAPTGALMIFAVMYFCVMIAAGMFDPLVDKTVRFIKGDPVKLLVGTAVLGLSISLDGDSVTTFIIVCSALVPIYRKMGINTLNLACITLMANSVPNILPWGGPTARLLAALKLDAAEVMTPFYPCLAVAAVYVIIVAYIMGRQERKRIGPVHMSEEEITALIKDATARNEEYKRPKTMLFNWAMTIFIVASLVLDIYPPAVMFAIATAIALVVNYSIKEQRTLIEDVASDVLPVASLVFAAGIFMGILAESKMASAIATHLISLIPEQMGSHFAFFVSLVSVPLLFVSSNDAFYFGIVPVFAETGATYGFTTLQIGLASLCGQAFRLLSPTVASIYVLLQMTEVNMVEWQIKTAKWAIGLFVIYVVMLYFVLGVIPF